MKNKIDIIIIGAMLIFALLLAMPLEIWGWVKGLFHKHEEEEVVEFHGNSQERIWLLTDHTFDLDANFH